MELTKCLIIFLIATAFSSAFAVGIGEKIAVNPNCFFECTSKFTDNDCLGFCIKRNFNGGQCGFQIGIKDYLCCCFP
ncbi:hypothetical protein CASFOL_003477 [Castilleja foliolosa]|uniref:Defensin-like domain-containing protein n=1 Tax=Castilleja foliolosa TaxID=1961234 RepID=A0ABD3EHP6_9LAMI